MSHVFGDCAIHGGPHFLYSVQEHPSPIPTASGADVEKNTESVVEGPLAHTSRDYSLAIFSPLLDEKVLRFDDVVIGNHFVPP